MLFKTHLALGALAALLVTPYVQTDNPLLFFVICVVCSLLPDVDHPNSKINNKLKVTKIFAYIFKHRGITHSIWPVLLGILLISVLANSFYAVAFAVGYLSHLLGDAVTKEGVDLLRPWSSLRIRGPMETGSFAESVLFWGIVIVGVIQLFNLA